jgi:hypothetical protein
MGARLSELSLWRMDGEDAVHGNALPNVMQHALCPPREFRGLTGAVRPAPWLSGKIGAVALSR